MEGGREGEGERRQVDVDVRSTYLTEIQPSAIKLRAIEFPQCPLCRSGISKHH